MVSASLPEYSRWIRRDRWEEVHQDGLLVELEVKDPNSENVVSYERLLSWKELGTTLDLYEKYGHLSNKAEPIPRRSGSVLVAKWGEGAMQAGLPTVADICCQIVATDAGYVGLSVILPAGAYPIPSFPGDLVYSPDGVTWHIIEIPTDDGDELNRIPFLRTPFIYAVEGGVVVHGLVPYGPNNEDCLSTMFGRGLIWVGDDSGSNWKLQELSEGSFHAATRWRGTKGRGVRLVSVIPSPGCEDEEPLYQGTIASRDGLNCVTLRQSGRTFVRVAWVDS